MRCKATFYLKNKIKSSANPEIDLNENKGYELLRKLIDFKNIYLNRRNLLRLKYKLKTIERY